MWLLIVTIDTASLPCVMTVLHLYSEIDSSPTGFCLQQGDAIYLLSGTSPTLK